MAAIKPFWNGEVEEDIYMEVPDGVQDVYRTKTICKILKALYGLKPATRRWNVKKDLFLKNICVDSSPGGPCFYVRKGNVNAIMVTALYVDDTCWLQP